MNVATPTREQFETLLQEHELLTIEFIEAKREIERLLQREKMRKDRRRRRKY